MTTRALEVARALVEIGAVGFSPHAPITFKSGLLSPVYVDNRRLPYWPAHWRTIIQAFRQCIAERDWTIDVIAGIEAAGIPHSAALGYVMETPSVFVRKQVKEHGTRSRIEGGPVKDKRVLLVEDLVTTSSSSLAGVEALQAEGANVVACLAIVSYGFPEARDGFARAGVPFEALTDFESILTVAHEQGRFSTEERAVIEDWLRDPHGWAERRTAS